MRMPFVQGFSYVRYDRRHQPVIDFMNKSLFKAFAKFEDLNKFIAKLEKEVQKCNKVSGAPQYFVSVRFTEDSEIGSILLQRKTRNAYVAHLLITRVKAILEYDKEADTFFDITERLED